jgi:hypothetical protein
MNKMKLINLIFGTVSLILLLSCEENNAKFIITGQETEKVNFQSFSPALYVVIDTTLIKYLPAEYYSELRIDLDNDNFDDIKFISTIGRDNSGPNIITTTKKCEISSIQDNVEITVIKTPMRHGDKISEDLDWKIVGPVVVGNEILSPVTLSLFEPETTDKDEIASNVWDTEDLYLAIRVKAGGNYKLGWIGLYIDDYYDFKIREIGLEK